MSEIIIMATIIIYLAAVLSTSEYYALRKMSALLMILLRWTKVRSFCNCDEKLKHQI